MSESRPGPRTVVDTNLFVSGAISPTGLPHSLLQAWRRQRFLLLLSAEHRSELIEVLGRPTLSELFRIAPEDLTALIAELAAATPVAPSPTLPLTVRDPKDAKILAAALGGAAEYLVTGDKDLLTLAGDPRLGRLRILTVVEFLAILDQRGGEGE